MTGTSHFTDNVGIAKQPTSYALDVNGTINCTEILVNGAAIEVSTSGTTATTSSSSAGNLNVEGNLTMTGPNNSITVAGDLNIGVDVSFVQSIPFTYKYLRIIRETNPGTDLVINGMQVWQNDENILSNPNLTDNSLNFYDSSDSLDSSISIGGGILETITTRVSDATYAWDFRESLTDFNGGSSVTLSGIASRTITEGLKLNGTSGNYATIPDSVSIGGTSTFVTEIYFQPRGLTSDNEYVLDFNLPRFVIGFNTNSELFVRSDNTTINLVTLSLNTLYHLVVVWSNNTTMNAYVDGVHQGQFTIPIVTEDTRSGMILGTTNNADTSYGAYVFIESLRFWNDPSSFDATDVATLYANRDVLTSALSSSASPTTSLISIGDYAQLTFPDPPQLRRSPRHLPSQFQLHLLRAGGVQNTTLGCELWNRCRKRGHG